MDVKWGSLYTVVKNLAKHGFLEVVGTSRQGARPERTVYQITDGRQEMLGWTRELLSTPEPEHPKFAAGLSVQMILPPDEVIALLGPARQAGGVDRRPSCCDRRASQGSSPPVPGRG